MRAFVGDMLPDEQRTTGFAVQTFFIGASSVIGSLLPWLLTNVFAVANTAPEGQVPDSVKWSFYLGGVVFFGAVMWTILRVKEYSPGQQRAFHGETEDTAAAGDAAVILDAGRYVRRGAGLLAGGLVFSGLIHALRWDKGLYILSFGAGAYGLLQLVAVWGHRTRRVQGLVGLMHDLGSMPEAMKRLALAQMLTWFALFAFFIYATAAVAGHHFGSTDPRTAEYNAGANWVGVLMSVYNGVAALVAFALPVLARRAGRVLTHVGCLVVGGFGLGSMYFFKDPQWLLASMVGLGVAWASLLTMPYAILSSVVPYRKMGVYMGMFNFFIVIPQILAAALLGLLVRTVFDGHAVNALLLGGVSMVAAALAMLRVKDTPGPRNP